jgi:hypothetical protein
MTRITAIETHYNGYRFRSRLEARWAVFYDTLGVAYQYEPEGFDTPTGPYLPDFYLPEQKCWVEIKGVEPTKIEVAKLTAVCDGTNKYGFIFFGDVRSEDGAGDNSSAWALWPHSPDGDGNYQWCVCNVCGGTGITYNGKVDRLPGECRHQYGSTRLAVAVTAARSARFEHDESQRPKRKAGGQARGNWVEDECPDCGDWASVPFEGARCWDCFNGE